MAEEEKKEEQGCEQCAEAKRLRGPGSKKWVAACLLVGLAATVACVGVLIIPPALHVVGLMFFAVALVAFVAVLGRNGLGATVYVCKTRDGVMHRHLDQPRRVGGVGEYAEQYVTNRPLFLNVMNPERGTAATAKRLLVDGLILQLRVGGWFRRNVILDKGGLPMFSWRILHGWDGFRLHICDRKGRGLSNLSAHRVLDIVTRFVSVEGMEMELRRAEATRDHLIERSFALIDEMNGPIGGARKSKHGQRARGALEETLVKIKEHDPDFFDARVKDRLVGVRVERSETLASAL